MSVVIGGIWHETNTFSPLLTDLDCFRQFQLIEGDAIREVFDGTNSELGGMLEAARELGVDVVPTVFGGAVPSGRVSREALDYLVDRICAGLHAAPAADGVVLALHGAMVAEGLEEADAYVLRRVRQALGPDRPLVATFDSHANLTDAAVRSADVLVGYDTLPHVDMAERGSEALRLLHRLLRERRRPCLAFRKLPLLTTPQRQATTESPMREVMDRCHRLEREVGSWTASAVLGFPYADVPHLGMAALAYADEQAHADEMADALAGAIWERREAFVPELMSPARAIARAASPGEGPVMLIEPADNVGGGAPGDGTVVLKALLERASASAAIVIWDPVAAEAAREAGTGARFRQRVGGNTLALHGPPVALDGRVEFCDRVVYRRDRDYYRGQFIDLGVVARVAAGNVQVILTSERLMPFDTMHLRSVGLVPETLSIIVMKCASNWSVAFGDIASDAIYVDTPGVCSSNLARMPYTRLDRACFPLDMDASWCRPGGTI